MSARIVRRAIFGLALTIAGPFVWSAPAAAQNLLIPMDQAQTHHLKAYGLTYWTLQQGARVEWLLNYRGGSFLLPDTDGVRREAAFRGVTIETVDSGSLENIRAIVETENMESVPLETAPRIAIYTPPNTTPWDDAVTIALTYAQIPYETVWDPEVLSGELSNYEWLHLHHEDFTGQYSKFYTTYAGAPWLQEEVRLNRGVTEQFGYPDVPTLKRAVAEEIRGYVEGGGFLFAMCTATETLDLALASHSTDIAAGFADGSPPASDASERMDWGRAFAFQGAMVELRPNVNAFSDIDFHMVNTAARQPLGFFTLFEFSAKLDPVPTMLVQNHESVIADFYGLTTSFRKERLKPGIRILADGGEFAKYVHGNLGEGSWTFYGGHDPEDPEHQIGDSPTNLDLHADSPGYRLILNNVLFPAARPRPLRT